MSVTASLILSKMSNSGTAASVSSELTVDPNASPRYKVVEETGEALRVRIESMPNFIRGYKSIQKIAPENRTPLETKIYNEAEALELLVFKTNEGSKEESEGRCIYESRQKMSDNSTSSKKYTSVFNIHVTEENKKPVIYLRSQDDVSVKLAESFELRISDTGNLYVFDTCLSSVRPTHSKCHIM